MNVRIALTPGEPAGIGPDLAVLLAQASRSAQIIAICDPQLLADRAALLGLPLQLQTLSDDNCQTITREAGSLAVDPVTLNTAAVCGQLNMKNSAYVLATLNAAVDGCVNARYHAMVTAPLHKGIINDAGIGFTGHTEYLAERTAATPVMMLASDTPDGPLRVALATTHLPLRQVSDTLTRESLTGVLRILHQDLTARFGIDDPRILVAGLNPHAGEGGHLGREEIDIIEPVVRTLQEQGMNLTGPLPADTLFTRHHLQDADAVMAMFHDQGLPVLKYAGFGQAINITLGLPVIRTSVDHGTALDKAGSGQIDQGSLLAAIALAEQLAGSDTMRVTRG